MARALNYLLIAICLGSTFAGCQNSPPPTKTSASSPQVVETSELSDQINLLATQTQVSAQATATAQPPGLPPDQPPSSGTAIPTVDLLQRVGPFRQVSLQEALIAGRVSAMLAPSDGSVILLSDRGYSRFADSSWTGYFTDEVGHLAGLDPAGRAWVITRDGAQIAVWEDDQWKYYGAEAGWTPVSTVDGEPLASGLLSGSEGDLWITSGSDVRRFDGTGWQVFTTEMMGMPPAQSATLSTNYILSPALGFGEMLVGRCDWGAAGPEGGGGLRAFRQGTWQELDPSLSAGCIASVHGDGSGTIWIGVDSSLFRLPPAGVAEFVPLPEPPPGSRIGTINRISTGPGGDVWVSVGLCAETGCYGDEVLYQLTGAEWQQVGEPRQAGGQNLLFDLSGKPWLFSGGSVNEIVEHTLQPVEGLVVLAAVKSASGEIWLVAQSTGPPTLWQLEP